MRWISNPIINFSVNFGLAIVAFVFSVWAYFAVLQTKEISHERYTRTVFLGSEWFRGSKMSLDGREISNGIVVRETGIVVWNSGTTAFSPGDVRKPLSFSLENTIGFFAARLEATKSVVPDNFSISTNTDANGHATSVTLIFKTFDPGMAAKVVLLHSVEASSISIDANFGPGLDIRDNGVRSTRTRAFALGFAALMIGLFSAFSGYQMGKRDEVQTTRRLLVMGAVLLAGLAVGAFLGREPLFMIYPPISPGPNIG